MAYPFLRMRVHRRNPRLALLDIQARAGQDTQDWSQ